MPPDEVDPLLTEHVMAIRNRFGVDGLRVAAQLIALEIAIFDDAYTDLPHDPDRLTGPDVTTPG